MSIMQDELSKQQIEAGKKGIQLSVQAGKFTLKVLAKAIGNYVDYKFFTGEQSIKNLIKSGKSLESIDLMDAGLKPFTDYAKKAGIDYSVLKDGQTNPPTWNIFFKGKDKAIIEKFMEQFTKDWQDGKVNVKEKTSILEKLNKFRKDIKKRDADKDKIKHRKQERAER